MLPSEGLVELSRWQFAFTALYHFIKDSWPFSGIYLCGAFFLQLGTS
jgi:hypothetical protein